MFQMLSAGFFLFAGFLAGYDLVSLIRHTADPNRHMPFLYAIALVGFGVICRIISRLPAAPNGYVPRDGEYDRSSYLHPDNLPKGRSNKPDGTSD